MKRGFWSDFKNFAIKGNALELAIAVVVGNAFSGIVNSLVSDIITPLLGLLTGNVDFKNLTLILHPPVDGTPLVLKYGDFFQNIFNFLVITLSIFIVFRFITVARRRIFREGDKSVPPEAKSDQVRLLEEIRDLLKEKTRV